jgi:hypothetical protein
MESEELIKLMQQVDAEGIGWDKVENAIKVPIYPKLYASSGPVPCHHQQAEEFLES